jgi:hypothetical protein
MPATTVRFFQDPDGHSPVVARLESLKATNAKAFAKCVAVIERLAASGYELRRPMADLLRDGIHELRTQRGHVNYRLLYFFHGRNVAILAHALIKEETIPDADIERALARKRAYEGSPELHTCVRPIR